MLEQNSESGSNSLNLQEMLLWQRDGSFMKIFELFEMEEEAIRELVDRETCSLLLMPLTAVSPAIIDLAERLECRVLSPNPDRETRRLPVQDSVVLEHERLSRLYPDQPVGYVSKCTLTDTESNTGIYIPEIELDAEHYDVPFAGFRDITKAELSITISMSDRKNKSLAGTYDIDADTVLLRNMVAETYRIFVNKEIRTSAPVAAISDLLVVLEDYLASQDVEYGCSIEAHNVADLFYTYNWVERELDPSKKFGDFGPDSINVLVDNLHISRKSLEDYLAHIDSEIWRQRSDKEE